MKKIISLTLSLIMIMTTLCALPFSAKADVSYDYKYYFKVDNVLDTEGTFATGLSDVQVSWYRGSSLLPVGAKAELGNFGYRLYLQGEIRNFDRNDDYKVSFNGVALEKNQFITGSYDGDGYYYEEISNKIAEITIQVTFYPLRCSSSEDLTYGGEGYHIENEKVKIYTDVKKYKDMHIADWFATYYEGGQQDITIPADWITISEEYGTELNLPMPAAPTDVQMTVGNCDYEEKVIKEATATEDGQKAQVCKVCGGIKIGSEQAIPKLTPAAPTAPTAPALKVKKGKKSFTASWAKVDGATQYEIQYSRNKKFKKGKKYGTKIKKVAGTKAKVKIKKLKSKKRYYVRIRVTTANGTSAWSKAKKVKVK